MKKGNKDKINLRVEDRAIIPSKNISIDKSLDIIKKKEIEFVLFVDEIMDAVETFTLSIGIYKRNKVFGKRKG